MTLASDLVHTMLAHDWPFNVREVEQRLKTAAVLAVDGRIRLDHAGWGGREGSRQGAAPRTSDPPPSPSSPEDDVLRAELLEKLSQHGGNVTQVSAALGKRRTTVQRWMRRLGIDPTRFR
jgi:transcriptional regulator of acetoin/glycerol metabolism